jgi:hypothetical protein
MCHCCYEQQGSNALRSWLCSRCQLNLPEASFLGNPSVAIISYICFLRRVIFRRLIPLGAPGDHPPPIGIAGCLLFRAAR